MMLDCRCGWGDSLTCRSCGDYVCVLHQAPGTLQEREYDRTDEYGIDEPCVQRSVICVACLREGVV